MNVTFLRVSGQDFMALGGFNLKLGRSGLYLIQGRNLDDEGRSNGAAKSSLLPESLSWSLFGKRLRGQVGVEDVIRKGASSCYVSTSFKTSVGKFLVTRERTKSKTLLRLDRRDGDHWVETTLGTVDATQEQIELLLGMDWKTFCSAVVFGQGSVFKFSSLSDRERREVLDKALGVDVYLRAAVVVNEDRLAVERELRTLEERIHREELLFKEAESTYREYEALAAREDSEQAEKRHLITMLKSRLDQEPVEFPYAKLKVVQTLLDDLRRQHTEFGERIRAERALAESIDRSLRQTGVCPLCGHQPSAGELAELQRKKHACSRSADSLDTERAKVSQSIAQTKATVGEFEDALRGHEQVVRERSRIETRIKGLEKELGARRYGELLSQAVAKMQAAKERAETLEGSWKTMDAQRRSLAYVCEVLGPSGMASAVIEHAVPVLNEAAAATASALTRGALSLNFGTIARTKTGKEIDKVTLEVESLFGADNYTGSSMGERATVDLCAGISVQSLTAGRIRTNLAVFDETLDHLDAIGGTRVLEHLRELAEERTVYLISHAEWVHDAIQFDGVVTVVRQDGVSQVEVE